MGTVTARRKEWVGLSLHAALRPSDKKMTPRLTALGRKRDEFSGVHVPVASRRRRFSRERRARSHLPSGGHKEVTWRIPESLETNKPAVHTMVPT